MQIHCDARNFEQHVEQRLEMSSDDGDGERSATGLPWSEIPLGLFRTFSSEVATT
jgi:hypothetical protein